MTSLRCGARPNSPELYHAEGSRYPMTSYKDDAVNLVYIISCGR